MIDYVPLQLAQLRKLKYNVLKFSFVLQPPLMQTSLLLVHQADEPLPFQTGNVRDPAHVLLQVVQHQLLHDLGTDDPHVRPHPLRPGGEQRHGGGGLLGTGVVHKCQVGFMCSWHH